MKIYGTNGVLCETSFPYKIRFFFRFSTFSRNLLRYSSILRNTYIVCIRIFNGLRTCIIINDRFCLSRIFFIKECSKESCNCEGLKGRPGEIGVPGQQGLEGPGGPVGLEGMFQHSSHCQNTNFIAVTLTVQFYTF